MGMSTSVCFILLWIQAAGQIKTFNFFGGVFIRAALDVIYGYK
jgi:hypothetical protein